MISPFSVISGPKFTGHPISNIFMRSGDICRRSIK